MQPFLKGLKVLDLSMRLPGPLATYSLNLSGAEVTKIENTDWGKDPFREKVPGLENFNDWYQNLNSCKKIVELSFKENQEELIKEISDSDIIIAPHSKRLKALIENHSKGVCIFLDSSKTLGGMHDLNALALTETFKSHFIDTLSPPYLPFAGIAFAQLVSQQALAGVIARKHDEAISDVIYLDEAAKLILDSLASNHGPRVLNNGAFPCYQIYPLKDGGHACLAAVEEHYWAEFCEVFQLEFSVTDRMDASGKVEKVIRKLFTNLSTSEIKEKIDNRRFCLTLIDIE